MQTAPPGIHGIPVTERTRHPLDRLTSKVAPRLTDLGGPGTVISPLILVGALSVAAAAGMQPMVAAAFAGQPSGVGSSMQSWLWLLAALSPVLALAKALILGAAAWAVLVLVAEGACFRVVTSAFLYGEVILALQGVWMAAVLQVRGVGDVSEPLDLRVASGIAELMGDAHPALLALTQGASVFHLAWMTFLALALASAAKTTRVRGFAAAWTAWSLVTAIGVIRALFT
jgi:hypothetical protein